jgi:hypothetical protein
MASQGAPVGQVVTLAALQQEGLQPVIGGFPAARPIGKARHRVPVPGFTYRARSGKSTYYRLETFLLEGSQGNDLMAHVHQQVEVAKVLALFRRQALQFHRGAAQPQLLGQPRARWACRTG